MTTYQVNVTMIDVHHYSKEEGEGKYIQSMDGFEIGKYPTISEAKQGIKEHFGYEPDPNNDIYDDYIRMTQVEDKEGLADENGNFIVDYTVKINKIEPVSLIGPEIWYQKNDPRF